SAMILTHEHPDHVGGFPLFMERIWLAKRRRPIPVFGPAAALDQARRIFEAFDTSGWSGMPEIEWNVVPLDENAKVFSDHIWQVTASPGDHSVPVIAIRVECRRGSCVTYSSDTARSDVVARLAAATDLLVHEASGDFPGHTSIQDAAHVARQAGAGRLVLVHLPPETSDDAIDEARASFPHLELGEDGATYEI
ncbi:MAG TPA: MBL fold metallo-hydrolase, partial [Longimicrobiaceae bacterium]|nr:MBL fold metallo-hydrolase [Longimicrobiaceae bacterium]